MASSLSWILRSSSVPVLRQSGRRRRRAEARSRHRSRVSSAGASAGPALFSQPASPSSHRCLEHLQRARLGCQSSELTCQGQGDPGPCVVDFRPGRGRGLENWLAGHGALSTRGGGQRVQQAHRGGSAGRWCAVPGSRSAAPPHPCTLCPGCRSCRHRSRPAPRGDPVSGASLSPGTSTPPARPTQPPANPSCLPPPATTLRACSRARQASWRKVKDLGGGTSWMAEAWFRRFTANSCRRKGRSAATRLPAGRAPPPSSH